MIRKFYYRITEGSKMNNDFYTFLMNLGVGTEQRGSCFNMPINIF